MESKTNKSPESVVREIKRKTHRKFNSEEKIRIILEGLKGEVNNSEKDFSRYYMSKDLNNVWVSGDGSVPEVCLFWLMQGFLCLVSSVIQDVKCNRVIGQKVKIQC